MFTPIPLNTLLPSVRVLSANGDLSGDISGITHDSRIVTPGNLFVCIPGALHDGHSFIHEAVERGAAAVVAQADYAADASSGVPPEVAFLTVKDCRKALPALACRLYGEPSQSMVMVGVTGTNGKTTTMRMTAEILRGSGLRVGTIGTLGSELDGVAIESSHTTPEADELQALLARMRDEGAQAVVMEVSSHALAQHRTAGIAFNAAIFTNLTQDHLDYHGTMEAYFEAKATLFTDYPVKYPRADGRMFVGSVNVGQWEGRDLVTMVRGDVITYSADPGMPAVLQVKDVNLNASNSSFVVVHDSGTKRFEAEVNLPIGGAFQVNNALGAIGAALRLGVNLETITASLQRMPPVPGRFQSVPSGDLDFSVIVDYAHTPDGLQNLLLSVEALQPGRILLVFGCGGDRDTSKRAIMGGIAGSHADIAIVTSDNPRTEDPHAIIQQVVDGMRACRAQVLVEPDRPKAIATAIASARKGDVVVLAGKGHEDYQIIGTEKIHMDDCELAANALSARGAKQ